MKRISRVAVQLTEESRYNESTPDQTGGIFRTLGSSQLMVVHATWYSLDFGYSVKRNI
jgi:hypothetical protein